MNLLFSYDAKKEPWNFEQLSNALLDCRTPSIILFRHTQVYQKHEKYPYQYSLHNNNRHSMEDNLDEHYIYYHFGFYCPTLWRLSPEVTGDINSTLFSVVPRYKQFTATAGEGQAKFAVLNSKKL